MCKGLPNFVHFMSNSRKTTKRFGNVEIFCKIVALTEGTQHFGKDNTDREDSKTEF